MTDPQATSSAQSAPAQATAPHAAGQKKTTLSLKIKNANALYSTYMPFLEGKGLFIPTNQKYALGDLIDLRIELLDIQPEFHISGKVAWLTPMAAQGNRAAGIGVQFTSNNAAAMVNEIEKALAGITNSAQPTHTM